MTVSEADLARIQSYVFGELSDDEAEAVRQWLIVNADDELIARCLGDAQDRDTRERLLGTWAIRPLRARLERTLWKARRSMTSATIALLTSEEASRHAFGTLGPDPIEVPVDVVVAVSPGDPVDLRVRLSEAGWIAVFAVEASRRLVPLVLPVHSPAGAEVELPGVSLGLDEDDLDVFVFFDSAATITAPPADADVAWLVDLLQQVPSQTSLTVVRRTLSVSPSAGGGKQR